MTSVRLNLPSALAIRRGLGAVIRRDSGHQRVRRTERRAGRGFSRTILAAILGAMVVLTGYGVASAEGGDSDLEGGAPRALSYSVLLHGTWVMDVEATAELQGLQLTTISYQAGDVASMMRFTDAQTLEMAFLESGAIHVIDLYRFFIVDERDSRVFVEFEPLAHPPDEFHFSTTVSEFVDDDTMILSLNRGEEESVVMRRVAPPPASLVDAYCCLDPADLVAFALLSGCGSAGVRGDAVREGGTRPTLPSSALICGSWARDIAPSIEASTERSGAPYHPSAYGETGSALARIGLDNSMEIAHFVDEWAPRVESFRYSVFEEDGSQVSLYVCYTKDQSACVEFAVEIVDDDTIAVVRGCSEMGERLSAYCRPTRRNRLSTLPFSPARPRGGVRHGRCRHDPPRHGRCGRARKG